LPFKKSWSTLRLVAMVATWMAPEEVVHAGVTLIAPLMTGFSLL
jgi:hypothetical protein